MAETTSTPRAARVHVTFEPHWANAWLVRSLARPFLRVDDAEHVGSWAHDVAMQVPAGHHILQTFIRYRGTSEALGTGRLQLDLRAGDDVHVRARNGWSNHMPFEPTLRRET